MNTKNNIENLQDYFESSFERQDNNRIPESLSILSLESLKRINSNRQKVLINPDEWIFEDEPNETVEAKTIINSDENRNRSFIKHEPYKVDRSKEDDESLTVKQRNHEVDKNGFMQEAHRIVAMMTIVARPKQTKEKRIDKNRDKSYLKDKLSILYKTLSELNNQEKNSLGKTTKRPPFATIPHDKCIQFNAYYEDIRTRKKRLATAIKTRPLYTNPHLHILIYDNADSLTNPNQLGVLLKKLKGKEGEQYYTPIIHLGFPSDESDCGLEEQRRKMCGYVVKYFEGENNYSHKDFEKHTVLDLQEYKKRKRSKKQNRRWLENAYI